MAPRLSGQNSIFGVVFFVSKSLLGIERQKKLEKFAILTRKPRCHARILIYRTWPIVHSILNLTKKGACCSKENQLLIVSNAYIVNLIWPTYGELKNQKQRVLLGVKNLQEYFVDLIII